MEFSIKTLDAKNAFTSLKTDCLVVAGFENQQLSEGAKQFITLSPLSGKESVTQAYESGDFTGKAGSQALLRQSSDSPIKRVLLLGLGDDPKNVSEKSLQTALNTTAKQLHALNVHEVSIALPKPSDKKSYEWLIQQVVMAFRDAIFRSDAHKSKKDTIPSSVQKIHIMVKSKDAKELAAAKTALHQAIALLNGMELAKDLGNTPANFCTPTHLANTAKSIAKDFGMEAEILDKKQIQSLKMNSFLSVTAGAIEPPKFIVLKHMGGKAKDAPVVLVGKGITFDTGGISLKPGLNMDEMKYDMMGAGSILGTMRAIGEMKLKLNVIAVIPSCENMPAGNATRPGDIVTSMSGQTIEILNTDAEGRLILCDALTYVERFNPACVIDVATLTGAIIVSLGNHHTGLFTRHDHEHDALADEILKAGKESGDTAWRMPIGELYNDQLKSNFADMANIGGPAGGSITAACFLERFTKKYTWAHLDIAGTANRGGAAKGATGRPVPLLTTFLMNRAKA